MLKKIYLLIEDFFEDSEAIYPYYRMTEEGYEVLIVGPEKNAMKDCKIIAAICHGPLMLIEADVIKNKKVTGFESIRTLLKLAGGEFIDRDVVVDDNIITSRKPADLPVFCKSIIELIKAYYK